MSPGEIYFNLIKGWSPTKPNELWCADVSYIKFQDRFWYISTIEDIFTRRVLAVRVSKRHDSYLIFSSLKQAVENSKTFPKIFHTDQGTEYMAKLVTNYLEANSVDISVSDKGSPWQNGFQESLFGRFKEESGDLNRFETTGEFLEAIYGQVYYYNYERIHTALRMSPVTYYQLMQTGLQKWGT
jgi:putative transposase